MAIEQPKDKSHFILPDLGEGVHEAELIRWKVKPGERVEEHQTLAEMETDKALVEVPSPWEGTIKELRGAEGDIITVGSVLVTYEGGDGRAGQDEVAVGVAESESEDAGTVVGSMETGLQVPDRFTRRGGDAADAPAGHKALATPAVRRVARELGVDINRVPGTGRGGRVTASDVHAFNQSGTATAAPARAATPVVRPSPVSAPAADQHIPFRGVRRTIAEALDRSVKTAVHFTVTDEADVTALDAKRREYAAVLGRKLSFLPIVMTAVCKALRQHPTVNANVDDDKSEIIIRSAIHLGIAVDTDHGLMVPVIKDTEALSIAEMGDAVAGIAERARNRTIERSELLGGTFTITNVGSFGGMFATPIINYPEVAILAVGRVKERMLVADGKFYAGRIMPLSLSCDHRVVDGAEGARFLNTVVRFLEQPDTLVG